MSWEYSIVKRDDEYGIYEVERDIDGEILDIINHPVSLQGYSKGEIIELLNNIINDLALDRPVINMYNEDEDEDQFRFDANIPVDKMFK